MRNSLVLHEPCRKCGVFYSHVWRSCRRRGFDSAEIARSERELCRCKHGLYYLHPKAFKPTGVALGFPLPDSLFVRRLWRISCLMEAYLQRITKVDAKTFAHVPPECYHVTIVNGTHFDKHRRVIPITPAQQRKAKAIIGSLHPGRILLFFNGFVLSREGRLLVRGYAFDNRLFETRNALVRGADGFGDHVPPAAHIKLGHILVNPGMRQLARLFLYTNACGQYVNRSVLFEDLYAPHGRISLVR